MPENTAYHYATTSLLTGCDGEGNANGPNEVLASESREQFHLSGWLVRAKVFDEPTSNWTLSLSSWIIKMMPYEEAEDVEPGSLFFSVLQEDKDWPFPYRAEGYGMNTNNKTFRAMNKNNSFILCKGTRAQYLAKILL